MGIYVIASSISDPALIINETHADAADVYVNMSLHSHGIDPDDVPLPNAILTEIATNWTKRVAAIEGAINFGEGTSPMIGKAREFEKTAELLVSKLSKKALGLETRTDFSVVSLTRA